MTDTDGRTSAAPLDTSMGGLHEPKDTWNDASLREFFDDGEEVRDLLVVVYDKTGVEPVGNDHPVVGGMFSKENLKLADMTNVSSQPRWRRNGARGFKWMGTNAIIAPG